VLEVVFFPFYFCLLVSLSGLSLGRLAMATVRVETVPPEDDGSAPQAYRKDLGFLVVPKHARYDPNKPFHFGLLMNIAFGLGATLSEPATIFVQQIHLANRDSESRRKSLLLPTYTK
jgi:hypothetical protein